MHRRYHDQRDPSDRSLLLDRYQGLARALAIRSAKPADDLDDLVQVALLGFLSALERFDPDRNIEFTTDVQTARRPGSVDARRSDDGSETGWEIGAIDGSYGEVEERSLLASLLPRLAPREREVLELRFLEEWTQAQIAERIGCSQMHVSRLLSRALSRLREWVDIENRAVARSPRRRGVSARPVGVI